MTERLQNEHNTARDRYNEHRDLIKPGYIASAEINERTLKRFSDSELGEITLIDSDRAADPASHHAQILSAD